MINSLNQTVDSLKKDKYSQQISSKSTFDEKINQQEKFYRDQITKNNENSKKEINDLLMKLNKYEYEAKSIKEKFAISEQNSENQILSLERKIN